MDEEMQQPQIRSQPYQSPMYNFGSSILVITNPDEVIHNVELTLRGMKETDSGEIIQISEPLMNNEGVGNIVGALSALVNRNTIMSNLDKNNVNALLEFTADTIIRDLMVNRVKYGIKSYAAREKIFYYIIAPVFVALKRGFEEGDKRFLKGSVQEIHSKIEAQKQKGILSSLNPWSRK